MKKRIAIEVVLMAGLFALSGARAEDKPMDQGAMDHADMDMSHMPGMTHGADAAHDKNSLTFGQPGDAKKVNRTVRIKALDTMRYNKRKFAVRAGETVRFTVTNAGKIRHEFVIGDATEQREHAKEMQGMSGMAMHDEANGVSLAPGETKSIVWRFTRPGTVELACHEPGHYQAGMISRVIVGK